jgi:hypothetical protein
LAVRLSRFGRADILGYGHDIGKEGEMKGLFAQFFAHLAWAGFLWIILMVALGWFLTKGRLIQLGTGLLRLLLSLIYSPIIYIRRSVEHLCRYGLQGEAEEMTSDQYLLNKIMNIVQAAVVILTVAGLAGGLVGAWDTFLPAKPLRESRNELRKSMKELNSQLESISSDIARLDEAWKKDRTSLIDNFKKQRNDTIHSAEEDLNRIERDLAQAPSAAFAFSDIKGRLGSRTLDSPEQVSNQRERLTYNLRYQYFAEPAAGPLLIRYIDRWSTAAAARLELKAFDEEVLRAENQPELRQLRERHDTLDEEVTSTRSRLEEIEAKAKLRFGAAFLQLLATLISLLIFIWVMGLVVEALWMGIRLATDVHEIRRSTRKPEESTSSATSVAA